MKEDIVLIGGGGFCKKCIDIIETIGKFKIAGIIDAEDKKGGEVLGYKIFASDRDIKGVAAEYKNFLITMAQVKGADKRKKLYELFKGYNVDFPTVISTNAHISKYAKIGEGSIVFDGAHISADAGIGSNCIINTSSVVSHDSIIGDHSHISTGSIVNGGCRIGEAVFLGSNSVVANGVHIACGVIVGAGGVVIRSIDEAGIYVGNPVRKI